MICQKHPKYKGLRKPTNECQHCKMLYHLNNVSKEIKKWPEWKQLAVKGYLEQGKKDAEIRSRLYEQFP